LNAPDARRLKYDPIGFSIPYECITTPQSEGWALLGDDTGSVVNGNGTYTLVDATTGSYGHGEGACYTQGVDLSIPATVYLAGRLRVTDYTLNGVFSGLGLGVHDNNRLYLAGLLEVNGLKHVGILRNVGRPYEVDSWILGPTTTATILTTTTMTIPAASTPVSLAPGNRFQVLSGAQVGVYTIASIVHQTTGVTTITVVSPFPDDPTKWDNSHAAVIFEALWDTNPMTYRMVVDTSTHTAQLFISGDVSGTVVDLTAADVQDLAITPKTVLMLTTTGRGQIFWGSLSREATSTSIWSFYRAGSVPAANRFQAQNLVIDTEMTVTPEYDTDEWFVTQDFGYSAILGGEMLLKSSAADTALDFTFGYGRTEPFITERTNLNLTTSLKVDSGTLGVGDALIVLQDSKRQVNLGTVQYLEDPLATPYRQFLDLPHVSMSGLWLPDEENWIQSAVFDMAEEVRGHDFFSTQTVGEEGGLYYKNLFSLPTWDEGGRIIESRLAVLSYIANGLGETGIYFGGRVSHPGGGGGGMWGAPFGGGPFGGVPFGGLGPIPGVCRGVNLTLRASVGGASPKVLVLDEANTLIQDYDFDWTDGGDHTYRLIADPIALTVTLAIDGVVYLPVMNLLAFDTVTTNDLCWFGSWTPAVDTASDVRWTDMAYAVLAPSSAKRTFGVYVSGDWNDIDSWRVPRIDSFDVPNSDVSADVKPIDWNSWTDVMVNRDPVWGVSVVFPLEAPPPGWTGDPSDFATYLTNPKAGWINVEQEELPRVTATFGYVKFGALSSDSITQQWWDYLRYRIFNRPVVTSLPSSKMVLNRYNAISSGERGTDTTVESVAVTSMSSTLVSLIPADMRADRVFVVSEGGIPISVDYWTFDVASQSITIDSEHPLSGDHVPVTVSFSPGKPITETYLKGQPLLDSLNLLNAGTPPFVMSQMGQATPVVVTSPVDFVDFVDTPGSLYDYVKNFSVNNVGLQNLLADAEDGRVPHDMAFEGPLFREEPLLPREVELEGVPILFASGGSFEDGAWNLAKSAPTWKQGMNRGLVTVRRLTIPTPSIEVFWDGTQVE